MWSGSSPVARRTRRRTPLCSGGLRSYMPVRSASSSHEKFTLRYLLSSPETCEALGVAPWTLDKYHRGWLVPITDRRSGRALVYIPGSAQVLLPIFENARRQREGGGDARGHFVFPGWKNDATGAASRDGMGAWGLQFTSYSESRSRDPGAFRDRSS